MRTRCGSCSLAPRRGQGGFLRLAVYLEGDADFTKKMLAGGAALRPLSFKLMCTVMLQLVNLPALFAGGNQHITDERPSYLADTFAVYVRGLRSTVKLVLF